MNGDLFPASTPPSADAPPASLTMVRVKRRRAALEPSGKRGDLTPQLAAAEPPAPTSIPPGEAPGLDLSLAPPLPLAPPAGMGCAPKTDEPMGDTIAPPCADAAEDGRADMPDVGMAAERLLAPPAEPDRDDGRGVDEIIDFWDSLRGGRDFPSLDELDRGLVAESWPNSVLLAFGASEADLPRITRLGEPSGEVEYTAMVTDWILSRGRQAAKRGQPMEEEQRFPISTGSARYRLLLLPFSSYGLKSDHVLCHVSRAEELSPVASFKRWLAL